jgi:protein subunit release factor B
MCGLCVVGCRVCVQGQVAALEEFNKTQRIQEFKTTGKNKNVDPVRRVVLHPYQLAKDFRTGVETHHTREYLAGDLDHFVQAALSRLQAPSCMPEQ